MATTKASLFTIFLVQALGGVFPLVVFSETRGSLTFYTPNYLRNNSFAVTAPIKFVYPSCNITSDYIGAIWLFLEYWTDCPWEGYEPAGLITPGSTSPERPPGYHYIFTRPEVNVIHPPRGQIGVLDVITLEELMAEEGNLTGLFESGDPNEWREMNRSVLCTTLFAFVIACGISATILSLIKLKKIIDVNGSAFSVAQISLGLISIGSLDLAAVFIFLIVRNQVEIISLLEIFALFLVFADACQTLACLAICVFWYDIMTDIRGATKKKISKRIAVPLIVAACIIVLLLLLLPFNLIVHSSQTIKVLVPVSYFVVALAISVSWLILGVKLLKSLRNKAAVSDNKRKMLKQLSNKIFITTALFFATRVLEVTWTICELVYTPLSAILTISLAAIFNLATNAMLSQVFNVAKNSDKVKPDGEKLTEQTSPRSD